MSSDTLNRAIAEHSPSHVFAMFSGGHDSLAATSITAQHPRFTAAVHINTGIGIEQTREFVRETCATQGWPLLELHADRVEQTYEYIVARYGFPGPASHPFMYRRLKERKIERLVREHKTGRRDRVMLVTGMRAGESLRRMRHADLAPDAPGWRRIGACVWGRRPDDVHPEQTRAFPILPLCHSCESRAA